MNGLFFGWDAHLLLAQLEAIGVTIALAAVGNFAILMVMKVFKSIRVSTREEAEGLDLSQHNETAYPSFTGMD